MLTNISLGINRPGLAVAGAGPSYDPAATALFARMTGTPTDTRKGLINDLIVSLKAAGIWSKLDIFYMHANFDIQSSLLNWTSSSFTCDRTTLADGDFTVDRGWTTNGTTTLLDTTYNPSVNGVNYTLNSASWGFRNLIDSLGTASFAGAYDGTNGVTLGRNGSSLVGRVNQVTANAPAVGLSTSALILQASRSASNALEYTYNGTVNSQTTASSARPNMSIREGALNATPSRAVQMAWLYAGGDLTQTEETNLRNACATYTTALGF